MLCERISRKQEYEICDLCLGRIDGFSESDDVMKLADGGRLSKVRECCLYFSYVLKHTSHGDVKIFVVMTTTNANYYCICSCVLQRGDWRCFKATEEK